MLRLEADGVERINSTTTRKRLAKLADDFRTRESVITALDRLTEAGVLEKTEVGDWRGGHDWRTTGRGRRLAEAFVGEWGHVLEADDEHTAGLRASGR